MLIPKILWFKKQEPGNYKRTWKILVSSHSCVIYRLCGSVAADYYTADMTGLFDYRRNKWSEELLTLTEIDTDILPDVFPAHQVVGEISADSADELGLTPGTSIVGSCDANVSALSAGVVDSGDTMISYGSVGAGYICLKEPKIHPKLYFGHYVKPDHWVSVVAL